MLYFSLLAVNVFSVFDILYKIRYLYKISEYIFTNESLFSSIGLHLLYNFWKEISKFSKTTLVKEEHEKSHGTHHSPSGLWLLAQNRRHMQ